MNPRQTIKETIGKNPGIARLFAHAMIRLARRSRRKGKYHEAVSKLCTGLQLVREARISKTMQTELGKSLNDACSDPSNRLVPFSRNPILQTFLASEHSARLCSRILSNPVEDAIRLRSHRQNSPPKRQGNLMVLKRPIPETGEKGVVYLKYNESFFDFATMFDLDVVAKYYRVVLEPSNACAHVEFYFFVGDGLDVVMQCPWYDDYNLTSDLGLNFLPVAFGASDWVDAGLFSGPADLSEREFEFDVAMVARWGPLKRHHVLFAALKALRPRILKTVLVGYAHEWSTKKIEKMLTRAGLTDQVSIREKVPPEQVADILRRSRVSVSVSLHEGAIRALSESLFCDTPVVVNRENVGVNRDLIVDQTGRFASDKELPEVLAWVIDNRNRFSARAWAEKNTGATITSEKLNRVIKNLALQNAEPWTVEVAGKANRPNLEYLHDADRIRLDDGYLELATLAGRYPGIGANREK